MTQKVPLLDLKAQYADLRDDVRAALDEVLESQYFVLGPKVAELEEKIAALSGARFGIGVSSGTDALLIAFMAEGFGPGDEVITSTYSFFATAGCIARVGARPVLVDIDPRTFNMQISGLESAINDSTRAIVPVHLYGQSADMDPVTKMAKAAELVVVEDAAQAIGGSYQGKPCGSFGDYGCFSFFPTKNLGGAGDGGMVVTSDEQRASRLVAFRGHGAEVKYFHRWIGGNFRLDALQAAYLLVKLSRLDQWTRLRRDNADLYSSLFRSAGVTLGEVECTSSGCPGGDSCELMHAQGIALPARARNSEHIYNQFVIRGGRRDELRSFLGERGVGTEIYYPVPFHLQECFSGLGYQVGDFPNAECAANNSLALPIFPELGEERIRFVVDQVSDFYS